jgi:leucyl-tRNA synthetase
MKPITTPYDHFKIEKKWQKKWDSKKLNKAKGKGKKFYALIEFPYPSGDGLHVGHIRSNTAMDIIARKRRREGYDVLYPIGWDAFGLPTENYAIKTGKDPAVVTKQNTDNFRRQLKSLGFSFDWSREVDTTDPTYYRWTQWIFLQFFKKGLAYKKRMAINWCPKDLIGLANEEVVDGKCERCGTPVEQREKEQWMLAITKYADRLDKDLDTVDFLERVKIQQRNWIGRSEGAKINFAIEGSKEKLTVFTTRPDTIYGVSYIAISKDHPLASKNGLMVINPANGEKIPVIVAEYVMSDYGTGVVMGVPAHDERDFEFAKKNGLNIKTVIDPLIVKEVGPDGIKREAPFVERRAAVCVIKHWSEDKYLCLRWKKNGWQGFVIGGIEVGEEPSTAGAREITEETGYKNVKFLRSLGGIVHSQFFHQVKDQNRFAHFEPMLFQLENGDRQDISAEENDLHEIKWLSKEEVDRFVSHEDMRIIWNRVSGANCYTGDGILVNSGEWSGKYSNEVKKDITKAVGGEWVTTYKLRDWVFSRQRYWGEPIPVVHCEKCGIVPIPEKDLPVKLPKVKNYKPTESGESPLASIDKWVNTKCPECKGKAKRETDTMPNWAGSSWYYLRYADPKNKKTFAGMDALKYWTPVDWYNGGMEHTTLHLLYSRFWHKFLFDQGLVPTSEPYQKRTSHGLILAEGGEKMSKSKGNVVNPDGLVETVGADSLRLYEMFMGPFDQAISWDTNNIAGVRRFIERVWKLRNKVSDSVVDTTLNTSVNKAIKKVTEDIEAMRFNTAVSSMMILVNDMEDAKGETSIEYYESLLGLLAPFAPHVADELWSSLGHKQSIHTESWPTYDESAIKESTATVPIQINGKVRDTVVVPVDIDDESLKKEAMKSPVVAKWLSGKTVKKTIVIKGKLVNIVVD